MIKNKNGVGKVQRYRLCLSLLVVILLLLSLINCNNSEDLRIAGSLRKLSNYVELFDREDNLRNNGRGYKDYLNTDGLEVGALLAWSESWLMSSYANMYKATKNDKYLHKLYDHIKSILSNRDDVRGIIDYKGEIVPAWGATRYTLNHEYAHFAVHTGMITYPILQFCQLVQEEGYVKYLPLINQLVLEVKKSVDYHNEEWIKTNNGGYYLFRQDLPAEFAGKIMPLNQQMALGRSLILLCRLTNEDQYCSKATDVAKLFKKSLITNVEGAYIWGYWPGWLSKENPLEDISHGYIDIDFAILAYKNGIVFTQDDMKKFAVTFKQFARPDRVSSFIDGSGDDRYGLAAIQWISLAEFDPEVFDIVVKLAENMYRLHLITRYLRSDWWGRTMFGISAIVLSCAQLDACD